MSQVSTSFPKIKHKNSVSSQHYTILCQWNPVSWDSDSCLLQNTFTDKSLSSRLRFVWCCYATPSLPKFWSPVQPFPQQIYNLWNPLQFCLVLPRRKILEIRTTKQNCRFPRVLFQPSIEAFIDRYCLTTAITFTVHPINIPHETLQIKCTLKNLPECFHHGNPPGNSPAAHLHCQFFQHIHPLSRSWQLWHLAHPGNPSSHTEWQWCSHTWFVTVQVDYWGELDLFYSISVHIILQRILHWINVLYFCTTSSIFIQLFFFSQSWAMRSHWVFAV